MNFEKNFGKHVLIQIVAYALVTHKGPQQFIALFCFVLFCFVCIILSLVDTNCIYARMHKLTGTNYLLVAAKQIMSQNKLLLD